MTLVVQGIVHFPDSVHESQASPSTLFIEDIACFLYSCHVEVTSATATLLSSPGVYLVDWNPVSPPEVHLTYYNLSVPQNIPHCCNLVSPPKDQFTSCKPVECPYNSLCQL